MNRKTNTTPLLYLLASALLALVACPVHLSAHEAETCIYAADIHTLRVRYAWEAALAYDGESYLPSAPFLTLSGEQPIDGSDPQNCLEISFDQFSHDTQQFSYTVRLLNENGTHASLSTVEYIRGFTTADIDQFERSVNTQQTYMHYSFTFPNSDMQLLVSGRYEVLIYRDGDRDNAVGSVFFSVVEPLTTCLSSVRSHTDIELDGRYQQLDLDIDIRNLPMSDAPYYTVVVQQNGRTDNAVVLTRPTYIESCKLRYMNQRSLIFEAGNEFRHFDSYSTYYAGYHLDRIRYAQGEYQAYIDADEVRGTAASGAGREGQPYVFEQDNNGTWLVNCEKASYPDVEAEYMWVHWVLPVRQPLLDGALYVGGGMFENRFTSLNQMQYDPEQKCYYLSAYLKQGGYEYLYYVVNAAHRATLLPIEGSHWQTRNRYTIWVYYHPFGARHDRIVGRFELQP